MHGDSNWIQTYSGRAFWPLDPKPEDVAIEDIAHALALKCRFAGHCLRFYSVAQHSVIGSRYILPKHALWFLLHNAPEAYLFDAPRPIKQARPWINEDEDRIMRCICKRFNLPTGEIAEVKETDARMLATESRDLMGTPPKPWTLPYPPYKYPIKECSWDIAERLFLDRFVELTTE